MHVNVLDNRSEFFAPLEVSLRKDGDDYVGEVFAAAEDAGVGDVPRSVPGRHRSPRGAEAQRAFVRNSSRRFFAQQASVRSVQSGRSLPYEIMVIREASTPCATR